eukprot:gene14998-19855_t
MFEEPLRFIVDVVREDRSVLNFLRADYTFVNAPLAKHYGMPAPTTAAADGWARIENAHRYERGGLLPMAVFLTANSPGLRTSPVKRGYWVVRRILGERIPPPPAVVPDLPNDEKNLGDLTLREVLAQHRADKSCASCHARFDSYGLVFEGFGPTGERREKDFGGRPVDTRAPFPGGQERTGLAGLREFRQQAIRALVQRPAFIRQTQALRSAVDEPHVETLFEFGDPARQRRLGATGGALGATEPTMGGNEVEVGQGLQIHEECSDI